MYLPLHPPPDDGWFTGPPGRVGDRYEKDEGAGLNVRERGGLLLQVLHTGGSREKVVVRDPRLRPDIEPKQVPERMTDILGVSKYFMSTHIDSWRIRGHDLFSLVRRSPYRDRRVVSWVVFHGRLLTLTVVVYGGLRRDGVRKGRGSEATSCGTVRRYVPERVKQRKKETSATS